MIDEVRQLSQDAAKLAAAPLWSLPDDEITSLLAAARRLEQSALALQVRLVQQADTRGLPTAGGHRTTNGWLRNLLRVDPQPARELAETAAVLSRYPATEKALLDGRIDVRQAAVIAATAEAIPAELAAIEGTGLSDTARLTEQAQDAMIDMAERLPAYQLRRVGERILTHIAPEVGEQTEENFLKRQENRAHRNRRLTLALPIDGMVRISGVLGAEDAATVHAALLPLCKPNPKDDRTKAQLRADALVDVCRLALRTGQLPEDGGEPPQLAITVAYNQLANGLNNANSNPSGTNATGPRTNHADRDDLDGAARGSTVPGRDVSGGTPGGPGSPGSRAIVPGRSPLGGRIPGPGVSGPSVPGGSALEGATVTEGNAPEVGATTSSFSTGSLGTATTDTGQRLSAATARRLACDAKILPVVLGGEGQILDAGRSRRLATGTLRRALTVRDHGCAHPDCDRPPRWTDSHHIESWLDGGPTDLDNLVLLCRHHHRLIHDPGGGWQVRMGPDRQPEFIPPPTVDPLQHPRRNLYHPRR